MVQSLVFLYFFGTDDIDDMFYPYTIHTCKNHIPWEEKEIDLDQLLKKDHMIFVTGFPASGKSQLLKHYIKTKCKWNDIFWLSDNSKLPLEDRLLDIKFLCKSHKTNTNFENILQRLSNKNSSSLLVIDIPSIKDKDFDFIHQHFDNLTLDIIIKTRTLENLPADKSVNLNNRPVSNLKQIFKSNASEDFFTNENSDDEFNRLCSIISYNPFIITLLAKSQNKKRFKIDKLLSTQSWYMDEKNLPTIHTSYRDNGSKSGMQVRALAARIILDFDMRFLADVGSKLAIHAKDEIKFEQLRKYCSKSDIQKSLTYGLLYYTSTDESILQMPAIIADIIWQEFSISYQNYKNEIGFFLKEISLGESAILPYNILYNHILTLIYRFHFQITKMKSKPDKKSKSEFLEWNQLLCDFILYFIRLGNNDAAKKVLHHLYFYEIKSELKSDIVPEIQIVERDIFQLHIDLSQDTIPITETLDKAIQLMTKTSTDMIHQKEIAIYISIIEKIYNFIIDMIETTGLNILFNKDPKNSHILTHRMVLCLKSFLNNYPSEDSIFYYCKMLYNFFTQNFKAAQFSYKKIDMDSNLKLKAKIWSLIFNMLQFTKMSTQYPMSNMNKLLLEFSEEYNNIFNCYHNKVSPFTTTMLIYYCSCLIYRLLSCTNSSIQKTVRYGLKEAYESITTQTVLSKTDMEYIDIMYQHVISYSK